MKNKITKSKPKKWIPKEGEGYYVVDVVSSHYEYESDDIDGYFIKNNLHFRTKSEQKKYENHFKKLLKERSLK